MADGYFLADGWAPGVQPGEVTLVTVEDREAAQQAVVDAEAQVALAADQVTLAEAQVTLAAAQTALAALAQAAAEQARDEAVQAAEDAAVPIPPGGNTGQVLTKKSGADRDMDWVDPPAAGEGGTGIQGAPAVWPPTFPSSPHKHPALDISDATGLGRELMKANTPQAARDAIGAGTGNGTSNLQLGLTGTTAMPGNHSFAASEIAFTPTGTVTATDLQAAVVQAATLGGGGGGSDDSIFVDLVYSAGSYPALAASYPANKKALRWFGPVAPPTTLPPGILFKLWTAVGLT